MCGVNDMASKIEPEAITQIMGDICQHIMGGMSLREVCRMDEMPSRSVVYEWLAYDAAIADQYARACSIRADDCFDEILEIADDATNDWMRRSGNSEQAEWVENGETIRRSALRIDSRKWALSKMNPKKYGDKLDLNHSGDMKVILESDADQL